MTSPPAIVKGYFPHSPLSPTLSPARHDDCGVDNDVPISPPLRPSTPMMHAGVVLDNDDNDDDNPSTSSFDFTIYHMVSTPLFGPTFKQSQQTHHGAMRHQPVQRHHPVHQTWHFQSDLHNNIIIHCFLDICRTKGRSLIHPPHTPLILNLEIDNYFVYTWQDRAFILCFVSHVKVHPSVKAIKKIALNANYLSIQTDTYMYPSNQDALTCY